MRPAWLKIRYRESDETSKILQEYGVSTVCEGANCPNIGVCFAERRATFLVMGRGCTRNCRFCSLGGSSVEPLDEREPIRLALAIQRLGLNEAVVTSVTRDDIPDGGAAFLAETVRHIKAINPGCAIELLVPDFLGRAESIRTVCEAPIYRFSHNLETVRRLTPIVRDKADYQRSLKVLEEAHGMGLTTKSSLMLGLGEAIDEIIETMVDLREIGCNRLALGQYLPGKRDAFPVNRYLAPEEFEDLKIAALKMGFEHVEAGPLIRSSYDRG